MKNTLTTSNHNSVELLAQVPHETVWLRKFISRRTKQTYTTAIRDFITFLGIRSAEELKIIDQAHVIAWRDGLIDQGLASSTINTKMSALSSLLDFLCDKQELSNNATTGIQRPRLNATEVQSPILTTEQVRTMLDSPNPNNLKGLRDRATLHLFFYTGCRISEICSLQVKDLYEDGGYWVLNFTVKGGKKNKIAIHHELQIALRRYIEARMQAVAEKGEDILKKSPLIAGVQGVFVEQSISRFQVHRIFHRYAKMVGLPDNIRPHSARATFITNALENGAQIEAVQRSVGHAKINTTQMYDKRKLKHRESASFAVRW